MKALTRSALLGILLFSAGCRSTNHLAEYDFHRTGIVAVAPLAAVPDVYTDLAWRTEPQNRSVVESVIRVGSAIVREAGAAEARQKLIEAEEEVDVAARIADGALDRVARMLGADPVGDERDADFALEVIVDKQGIFAIDSFTGSMQYGVDGKIRLVALDTGRKVWERKIRERETFASSLGGSVGDIVSGAILLDMTTDEMVAALERLADRMAASIIRRMADDRDD